MRYLIDGHNLIPKVGSISLQEMDDEEKLLGMLNQFVRQARAQVEVFFDKAPAGFARTTKIGAIKTHFIQSSSSADYAIIETVRKLGSQASRVTVVSSDRAIQNSIKRSGCRIITSEEFAYLMHAKSSRQKSKNQEQQALTEDEIQGWLSEFNRPKNKPTS